MFNGINILGDFQVKSRILSQFKASLVYRGSSKTVKNKQRNSVLKNKSKKQTKKQQRIKHSEVTITQRQQILAYNYLKMELSLLLRILVTKITKETQRIIKNVVSKRKHGNSPPGEPAQQILMGRCICAYVCVHTSSKTVCDDEKLCAIQRCHPPANMHGCLGIQLQDQAWVSESTQ